MLDVLRVTFPFFALVLCGYAAARQRVLPLEAIAGLNSFVLFFALPCMLFRFGASTPITQLLDASVFLTYLLCALLMVALAVGISLNARIRWKDASLGALVAAFPNTGFMGVPLLVALLGSEAAGPAIVTILVDMVITTSLCLALAELDAADEHGVAVALRRALAGMVKNPMAWAILLGAVFSWQNLELLAPVAKTVGLLGDAASPVALFTIGAVLARSQMLAHERAHGPLPLRDYGLVALLKLFVHPLLVWGVASAVQSLGVPLPPFALVVMVLVAALPSASNVSLLAERLGADNGRIARIILVTTASAFVTFSAVVALLRP
ncbi:MAG: AEC family transporter [Betaproteobacteria bacterium]|nr:AEC family transporter [Betaproteobacteria bacterium]